MLLKELNLLGFGKFENKKLILDKGINIIYGENEAGKSTLHSFINGMFYGFLRPNVKSTLYLEEHERYNPWNHNKYAGIIRFEYNGKAYIIERNFTKGEEKTKIIDEVTGRDITKDIDAGNGRVLQPGNHFFGFNSRVFYNTIFIKQLGIKTDKKLANEVTEKLINFTTSLDDNISIDNAIEELKAKMADIGSDKAYTKPYAINLKYIDELQERRKNIILEKNNYESYIEEEARLKDMLNLDMERLSKLKYKLNKVEILEKAKKLQESEILLDEINNIEKKITTLKDYEKFSIDEYNEIINFNNSIDFLGNNIADNEKELIEIENKIKSNNDEKDNNNEIVEKNNDNKKDDNRIELLKKDYKDFDDKLSKVKLNKIIVSISLIILLFIGIIFKKYFVFAIILPLSVLLIYLSNKSKEIKIDMETTKSQINKLYIQEEEKQKRIEEMESYRNQKSLELYNELSTKKDSLINKINQDRFKKEETLIKLKEILFGSKVNNIEEYREGLDKKNLYEKYLKELESKKELLIKVVGDNTIEGLKSQIKGLNITLDRELLDLDKNQLRYEIEKTNESISDFKIALKGVEENLKLLGKDINQLVEIEEELERRKKYKDELEFKTKSLELAIKTIEDLSKDIHYEFAPSINNQVSKIVEKITDGKYNKIKVSEELDINMEDPITGEIIEIDNLSGGTIDQLYFSLRFGIANSMVGDKLPLILDDCFIQYDNNRLRNIMKFLYEISHERQIILFTCHNRENIILDEIGVDFNLINLS